MNNKFSLSVAVLIFTVLMTIFAIKVEAPSFDIKVDETEGYGIFGYTNIGYTSEEVYGNTMYGSVFTSPSDVGTALSISFYTYYYLPRNVKAVLVFHNNLSIVPNGIGNPVTTTTTPSWFTSIFSNPPSLSPNTEYVLMMIPDSNLYFYYVTGETNQGHYDWSNNYANPTDPTDATYNIRKYSIYCNYSIRPQTTFFLTTGNSEGLPSNMLRYLSFSSSDYWYSYEEGAYTPITFSCTLTSVQISITYNTLDGNSTLGICVLKASGTRYYYEKTFRPTEVGAKTIGDINLALGNGDFIFAYVKTLGTSGSIEVSCINVCFAKSPYMPLTSGTYVQNVWCGDFYESFSCSNEWFDNKVYAYTYMPFNGKIRKLTTYVYGNSLTLNGTHIDLCIKFANETDITLCNLSYNSLETGVKQTPYLFNGSITMNDRIYIHVYIRPDNLGCIILPSVIATIQVETNSFMLETGDKERSHGELFYFYEWDERIMMLDFSANCPRDIDEPYQYPHQRTAIPFTVWCSYLWLYVPINDLYWYDNWGKHECDLKVSLWRNIGSPERLGVITFAYGETGVKKVVINKSINNTSEIWLEICIPLTSPPTSTPYGSFKLTSAVLELFT